MLLLQALESTFVILTGENWSDAMFALMTSMQTPAITAATHLGVALIASYFVIIHLTMTSVSKSVHSRAMNNMPIELGR